MVKVQLYTDRNQLKGFDDELIRRFANKEIAVLTFETQDQASPATETTPLNSTTAVLDGTTTPYALIVTATSAKDKTTTGVGARSLHVCGLKATDSATPGNGVPYVATALTRGTNTGKTADGTYWCRIYGARIASAGSEGDNASKITISGTAAASTYFTITAAGGCSSVGRIYIPAGWAACCFRADWSQNQGVTATAHAFYSVRYVGFVDEYYNTAGAAATITRDRFAIGMANGASGTVRLRQIPLRASTSSAESYITFHGDLITGTLTGSVKFYVVMVKL